MNEEQNYPPEEGSQYTPEENTEETINRHRRIFAIAGITIAAILIAIGMMVFFGAKDVQPTDTTLSVEQELALQEEAGEIIQTGDIEKCDEITNETYRAVCRNNIVLNVAQNNGNIALCANIDGDLVSRESCERKVLYALLETDNTVSVCERATIDGLKSECQNTFYLQQALSEQDASYCAQMKTEQLQSSCADRVEFDMVIAGDPVNADCSLFEDTDLRDDCMTLQSVLAEHDGVIDAGMCESFQTEVFRTSCFNSTRSAGGVGQQ